MWKRIAIVLGIYIIFRELPIRRRADGLDYEAMLAECRKRGWESCDELKETLDCSRRLIEEIANPDELKRLREKETASRESRINEEKTRRSRSTPSEGGERRVRAGKTCRGAYVSYTA
jgi:hypothetical protein